MFGSLTQKFQDLALKLSGNKTLTEENISEAVTQVRLALLDADVSYGVVSNFIKKVKEKAVGTEKLKGVKAGDQFISIVHNELIHLMGESESKVQLKHTPTKIILCGLQGSGKTTHAAKLAKYFKDKYERKCLIVALDLARPAAVQQLKVLGASIGVDVFALEGETNPVKVAKQALKQEGYDLILFDTAGRLHIDESLMKELRAVKDLIEPHEVIFIANAASGQDAVKTAKEFDEQIGITGSILTMLDGTTRAGAAISIYEVTKKPLLFEGVGEKVGDLQEFNPHSMADRILGMGDLINLMKKAESEINEEESQKLEEKFRKATFTYDDYLKQMAAIKRMGPLKGILKMLPGIGEGMFNLEESEKDFSKMEAIILSMTKRERFGLVELIPSRKRRVAKGSGTSMDDVNRLIKGFKQLKMVAKGMPGLKKKLGNSGDLDQLSKKFSGLF